MSKSEWLGYSLLIMLIAAATVFLSLKTLIVMSIFVAFGIIFLGVVGEILVARLIKMNRELYK